MGPSSSALPHARWLKRPLHEEYDSTVRRPPLMTMVVFGFGLVLGWLGGTSFSFQQFITRDIIMRQQPYTASDACHPDSSELTKQGWKTLDVFVGQFSFPNDTPIIDTNGNSIKWVAQARQDEAIFSLLGNKTNGFFVDLAANDAITLSNTYSLERFHGWKGICMEPNPMYWYNLTHFRPNCQIVGAVVGSHRDQSVHFYYEAGDHGGITGDGFDNGAKFKTKSKMAYTVTLHEILQRYRKAHGTTTNSPKMTIDYLSLDVEGAEDFILEAFPMELYEIHLITVERPKETLRTILESNGFEQIQRLSRWGETLWAHRSIRSRLDLSRLDEFSGRRQYLEEKARRETTTTAQ